MNAAHAPRQPKSRNLMPLIIGISLTLLLVGQFRIADPSGMGPGFGVSASAAGALYTCVVLLSLHSSRISHTYWTACIGTLLICAQIYAAPSPMGPGGAPQQISMLMNVGLVLLSVWGTALLGITTVHRARRESAKLAEAQVMQEQARAQQVLLDKLRMATETAGLWLWESEFNGVSKWDMNRPNGLGLENLSADASYKRFSSYIDEQDLKGLWERINSALAAHEPSIVYRYKLNAPDGSQRHYQVHARLVYDADDKPLRLVGATNEITQEVRTSAVIQRHTEEESNLINRLTTATQAAGIHCWQVNFPNTTQADDMTPAMVWSENAAQELGYQTVGNDLSTIFSACMGAIHPDDLATMTEGSNAAMRDGVEHRSCRYRSVQPDGSIRHLHAYQRFFRHPDGRPSHIIGATSDITYEVQAAQQLERQAEELRNLHTRVERAAMSSQEGHWELDLITREHWASASYRALLGYSADFELSTLEDYRNLVHPEDLVADNLQAEQELSASEFFTNTRRMRHANGEWRWIQARGAVERDVQNQPLRITGSIRDVHEQKIAEEKLQAAQERFNRAINGTQDGLWEIDLSTRKLWLSPRYSEMLGYDPGETSEWNGADLDRITHPDDLLIIEQRRQQAVSDTQSSLVFEHRMLTKSGEWIWVKVRGVAELDAQGKPVRMAGSMSDVTETHLAHEQLLKATEEAHEANRAKSAFLANMSHEIRTPMNGIIGMTGLLLDTTLDHAQHDFAETIHNSANSLLSIINDILDFSKIEAGKLDIENLEMDLRSNVEDVGAMLGFQAASKDLELIVNVHPEIPERVLGDPQRIRQCLINLVGNAIKFTRQGEVAIEVSHIGNRDGKMLLHFEIRDTGIGLTQEAATRLFQPFVQADSSTTRKYGGTGLGLSIVKRLIELMGGKVGVNSIPGQGSTFWFTLPLEATQYEAHPPIELKASHGKRILIVDDNETNQRVLSLQLNHLGYDITVTDSGAAALQELHRQLALGRNFDVVLADFQMPDMDGAMLGEQINADTKLAKPRLVLLTSMDRHGDAQRFAAMGFAAYLTKPIRARELRDCLQRVLARDAQAWRDQSQPLTQGAIQEQVAAERFSGRILLVDDNTVNQKVAGHFLERMGLTVVIANDGTEAIKAYESQDFDLVFMDLQMPVMDGFEATRRIRDFEAWRPRTPIIALTANAMSGQMQRCLASGMDGFLTKPIEVEQLREIVATHCQRQAGAVLAEPEEVKAEQLLQLAESDHANVLNLERFKEVVGGDHDFLRELAQLYINSARDIMTELQAAQASGDMQTICRILHKLKGASANIHAEQVRDLCEVLEKQATTQPIEALATRLQQLQHGVAILINRLDALLQDNQSAA
ncbi:MAG: PAS domain-containing protein [Steroidobacteraceae bacterium]